MISWCITGCLAGLTPSPLQGHLYRLSLLSDGAAWNVNAACQNMAAILNDPKRGKQKDFFTRTWGDSFVESNEIPPSPLLPEVNEASFSPYLKKIAKRYKKSPKRTTSISSSEVSHLIPTRHGSKSRGINNSEYLSLIYRFIMTTYHDSEGSDADLNSIPKEFLQPTFNLSQSETFFKVFPFIKEAGMPSVLTSGKSLQEKLSCYLDVIEMQIAHQISHKSDAFFQAVASHDTVREELGKALTAVKALRLQVNQVDTTQVQGSLKGI